MFAPVAEKKVPELPAGPRLADRDAFRTRAEAEAAVSPSWPAKGRWQDWLLTPGPKSAPTHGDHGSWEVMTPRGNADPIAEVGLPEFIEERMFTLVGRVQVGQPGRTHRATTAAAGLTMQPD